MFGIAERTGKCALIESSHVDLEHDYSNAPNVFDMFPALKLLVQRPGRRIEPASKVESITERTHNCMLAYEYGKGGGVGGCHPHKDYI